MKWPVSEYLQTGTDAVEFLFHNLMTIEADDVCIQVTVMKKVHIHASWV